MKPPVTVHAQSAINAMRERRMAVHSAAKAAVGAKPSTVGSPSAFAVASHGWLSLRLHTEMNIHAYNSRMSRTNAAPKPWPWCIMANSSAKLAPPLLLSAGGGGGGGVQGAAVVVTGHNCCQSARSVEDMYKIDVDELHVPIMHALRVEKGQALLPLAL